MTPTILTNLALSKIGQTLIKALGDTTDKSSRLAALHYEPTLREALRAHFWGFAMTTRPLVEASGREYLEITGPLKLGRTAVTFPRLYLQEDKVDGKAVFTEDPDDDSAQPASSAWWNSEHGVWTLEHGPLSARWQRGIDVNSPELTTLRPAKPEHFLETSLAGDHNDLRFEQVDQGAPPVSIEFLEPALYPIPTFVVTGRHLTVTPASRERMIVSGASTAGVNGTLSYAGLYQGNFHWTTNGQPYSANHGTSAFTVLMRDEIANQWICRRISATGTAVYDCRVTMAAGYPDGLTWSTPGTGAGTCTVSALASSAQQLITALERPAPRTMRVTGLLTSNGTTIVIPKPMMETDDVHNGRKYYGEGGQYPPSSLIWCCAWDSSVNRWYLGSPGAAWQSFDDVPTPDLANTWTAVGSATGLPILTIEQEIISASTLVSVSLKPNGNGTGAITAMPKASLSGGVTGEPVVQKFTPATEIFGWSHAFEIPADFIKAKTLRDVSTGRKIDKFSLRRVGGKTCVLCNHDAVSLEYVQYIDDPAAFDSLFVKAFATLLAAKLARAICGSDDMEARFLQIFETVDLPAARTASGHETDSSENHPLRELLDGTLTPGRGDFFGRL